MGTVHSLPHVTKRSRSIKRKPNDEPEIRQWTCNICQFEIGVATSEIIELTLSPMLKRGKLVGGTKQKVCAKCYIRGRVTRVP